MVVADDGTLYITRRSNDVVALKDTDGDGNESRRQGSPAGAWHRPAR